MRRVNTQSMTLHHTKIYQGYLLLIDAQHPLRTKPEGLREVAPGIDLERRVACVLEEVLRQSAPKGEIIPVSGYRSAAFQREIFEDTVRERGLAYTQTYVARPDCSEHQAGFAIDVGLAGDEIDFIAPYFPYEGIAQRFREIAVRYGFIQRYPRGREHITAIGHEPWHFRFVGAPHAQIITQANITLEEYLQWIKEFPASEQALQFSFEGERFEISYIQAEEETVELAQPCVPYTISGNNEDGFILTTRG